MIFLFWWFHAMLCKHVFSYDEAAYKQLDSFNFLYKNTTIVSATCDKCGWHRTYSKFGV